MHLLIRLRLSWDKTLYKLAIHCFFLIFINSCVYTAPIFKNYQGSEVPDEQIAIIDTSIHINRIFEFKGNQELVYDWKRDGDFRQARLKPGEYLIELVSDKHTSYGQVRPYKVIHRVHLKAGHKYQTYIKIVDYPYPYARQYVVGIEDKAK